MPEIPRLGFYMQLPNTFTDVEWYGRGPQENYIDRKESALVGLYHKKIEDFYHPYIRPQENGNRTENRMAHFYNKDKKGFIVKGNANFDFCVLPFAPDEFDFKGELKHTADLEKSESIHLHIDYGQMGLGGDDSWGAHTHDKYKLFYQKYDFSFFIQPDVKEAITK